ncbi:sushi, von Willebrand factor type A, EGF and pentraxin domain-containing protein 1-like isoform X1 [Ostrea edulis]|uniref:sushi, von Willebrand factor type A, EGF and pentraxin domain-containing protein 1-like isoform X1 n=1 Tax=Ostrea edulis TaxID=37623 RepID=UPI0024AF3451|nr:sushi, von Willebrand factor type A, EGF and pentraxin domain-containing protein 1-like isoform X1 [Ostrea edulis]
MHRSKSSHIVPRTPRRRKMNYPRTFFHFLFLFQVVTDECVGHSDGVMGDIQFKCPSGCVFYQGYCYRKMTVPMTWEDAMTTCLRSGMYFPWIEDDIENEYVATKVMSNIPQYWIGLSKTPTAGQEEIVWSQHRMSENKPISLVQGLWKNLQPMEFTGDYQCVSTLKDKEDNHWTVTNCRGKLPFVCKLMGAPNPHDIIFCGNRGYIHKNWLCDGQNDCGDMSDENNCPQFCSELRTVEKGGTGSVTMSTSQPTYTNNAFCTWTIQAPVGVRIKVTISSTFHLEDNADVLRIWTGGITLKESNFLGSLTGNLQTQQEFYSQNNYIIMQLSMDNSNVRGGFTADYTTVDETKIWNGIKPLTANSNWQTLESPLYGKAVSFGLQLEWLIVAESDNIVSLEFTEVDLPTSSSLKIYDGEGLTAPLVFSLTKTPEDPIYISQKQSVRIVMSTDHHEYAKYRGFQLKYKQGCTLELKQEGTIYSPGYQLSSYPSNVTCTWVLTRNSGETRPISLRFAEFKLKSDSDFIEIYNDTAGTALHTGSGLTGTNAITEIFSSTDGHLNVTFKSNLVLVEKGFKAEFSIDCPMLILSEWTINSKSEKYTGLHTVITLSCKSGYSFKQEEYNRKSSVDLKCLPGGNWNLPRIPDCQITYCSTPPAVQNGILKEATGPKVGDNATYECNGGFTIGGSPVIQCKENGMWETPPQCYAQQCSPITKPTNGEINTTAGSGTEYASVLMFSCDPGYDLVGSVYIHCKSDGNWSHPVPTCQKIKCPIPQVMYGMVEASGDVEYKGTAKLNCSSGFIVNGTNSNQRDVPCGSDGLFSALDPCVNDDECSSNDPCVSFSNNECEDTFGSYVCNCKDGYGRPGATGPCLDIDECSNDNGGCSQNCENSPAGSFRCVCQMGYQLYTEMGFNNISLAEGETGTKARDKIRVNYTCVRAQCPTPIPPTNGKILSNKQFFYYEDEIMVECDHGYFPDPLKTKLKCGVDQSFGKWSTDMTNCTKGTCMTPTLNSDPYYNKIFPSENSAVEFGTEVIIECKYGSKFRNLSLYCGESSLSKYNLLGDNLTCPVIDCGTPEQVPGANLYSYTNTLFGSTFNYSCQSGSILSGESVNGDYRVTCQENGQWSFGNLTCTGGRCTDPGTPGGAFQVVRSYEAGEILSFRCERSGYQPVPSSPFLCEERGTNNATWNSTISPLPMCTDVTPPMFKDCPKTIYIDKMEAVSFVVPTATDNSGLVKNVTVDLSNFKPGTVISTDTNVTYTAVDNSGNVATCTISFILKDRQRPGLICNADRPIKLSINTTSGATIDVFHYVSNISALIYDPGRYITVDTSTLNAPQQVKVTAKTQWGTEGKCSLLIYTEAEVCFTESLSPVSNAKRGNCLTSDGNIICPYTCNDGYVYYDGNTTKTYSCSGKNNWSPSSKPEDCLPTQSPSYKAEFQVKYAIGTLAAPCLDAFEKSIAASNLTIAGNVDTRCIALDVGKFVIKSFTSTALHFEIDVKFKGEFLGNKSDSNRDFCTGVVAAVPSTFLHSTSVQCPSETASVTVTSMTKTDSGNKCSENMNLINTDSGNQQCVPCPQGMYFTANSCRTCPDAQYQDAAGQSMCKDCPANTVSRDDRTGCTAQCPLGSVSKDGMTGCQPCKKDEYWMNATHCEPCPAGYVTDPLLNGATNIGECKVPCPAGKYSLNGYEPCQDCPLHHYQTDEGKTMCSECSQDQRTLTTGKNSSSDCVVFDPAECNTTKKNCGNGKCHFLNHEAVCACYEGYSGDSCETALEVCQSMPCFNGGTCVRDGSSFNCTCPSLKSCILQERSGSFVVDDADYERAQKKSLALCKEECLQEEKCKAIYHLNSFCFIIYKDLSPKVYVSGGSRYFDKICNHTYLFSGKQCETDLNDQCKPDSCRSHGMCQDKADGQLVCLCPIVGEYSQPRCDLVQNLCSPNPCQNGASCVSWGAVRRQCICKAGYSGVNCSVNANDCDSHRDGCLYNGTCNDGVDSYTCGCRSGFSGRHCQVTKNFCSNTPCPNGGCVNDYTTLTPKCFCDYPYQLVSYLVAKGKRREAGGHLWLTKKEHVIYHGSNGKCELMDLCNNTVCNNGTCDAQTGKCSCNPGYEGSSCQHSEDDCKTMPCKNGGKCVDGHRDYTCECVSGFTGKNCDEDPNDCPGSCDMTKTAETKDKINGCECVCKPGYTSKNCSEEIDECASFPCKHGAMCTDRINGYHCNCSEGWSGTRCDQQIDFCQSTSNKCLSGDCYNLIDDKYCRCSAGTRGDTCEVIPDVCSIISPCSTTGSCKNVNGTASCSCQTNYAGDSCQLIKDFCTATTNCLYNSMPNTGTCTNLESGGFECTCQSGYSGTSCQTQTTLCSTLNCGSAMCNEEIGCYCPEGKVLAENKACKSPSSDFDMLFDIQMGDEGASTKAVLPDVSSDLSFMLWVRFSKDQKETEDAVLLKLGDFMEVKNNTIVFMNATKTHTVDIEYNGAPIQMDDGGWHFIVVSWKQNGNTLILVDNIHISDDNSLTITLPKELNVEVGKKFGGRLSQVKLWANSLQSSDMFKLHNNKDYVPAGSVVIYGWYNYKMSKGVVKKIPSQIQKEVCDVPACSQSDKIKPMIKGCASDSATYSQSRIFEFTQPRFDSMFDGFNDSLSLSSHPKSNTFTWGGYNWLFVASDNDGNTAVCHSKLYVKYNTDCPPPRTSSPSSIKYCTSSKSICEFKCTGTQELSRPTPKYKLCSELGVYNPLQPQEKFVLPSCGDTDVTTIQVDVSMRYSFMVSCSETFESSMKSALQTDFQTSVFNAWNNVCTTSACANVEIMPACVFGTQEMIVTMKIKNLRNGITRKQTGSDTYTPKEVFRVLIFVETVFESEDIGGAKVLNNQVVITDIISCPDGYMVIGDRCVECSKGTFYNSTSQNCEYCPLATYGNADGLTTCTPCGSGKTTLGVGYYDSADCVDDCRVGQFWDSTLSQCALCQKHFYQHMTGQDYCLPCPLGKKTSGTGSNSSSQCYDDCKEGTELKPDGNCVPCQRGYFRSFLEDVCTLCPAGKTTAKEGGAASSSQCDITICYNGAYRNSSNVCVPCPVGEYQSMDLQDSCQQCKTNYTTESVGKNNITDCKFHCPKGYDILDAANETCQPCERGYYKDNMNVFSTCMQCPPGNTTEGMKATSSDNCSISICSSGQELDQFGACVDCELDQYQKIDKPTSTDKCVMCEASKGTKQKMSNSSSDCLPMCSEGNFHNATSNACELCPKGTWNNGNFTMKFESCVACPVNMTTTGPGMISADNCTLLDCSPGSYISDMDCLPCDFGTYQPDRHQTSCIDCGTNLNTSAVGATSRTDCQIFCPAGFEGQDNCTNCQTGFVKNTAGISKCSECTGNYTSNKEYTICDELFCDKGFYINTHQNMCMPCDIGYYKKDRGNTACSRCPEGFLTMDMASTAKVDCSEQQTSDSPYIIGGAVGGVAAVVMIALIIVGIIKCLRRSKDSTSKYEEEAVYTYILPSQMYEISSNRESVSQYTNLNPAYTYDELFNDSYSHRRPSQMYENDSNRGFVSQYTNLNPADRYDERFTDSSHERHSHDDNSSAYQSQEAREVNDL